MLGMYTSLLVRVSGVEYLKRNIYLFPPRSKSGLFIAERNMMQGSLNSAQVGECAECANTNSHRLTGYPVE